VPSRRATRAAASVITLLVLLSWIAAASPVRDALTLASLPGVRLMRPFWYVVLAPACTVLDALTLLSVRQNLAVILSLALIYVLWRIVRWFAGRRLARRSALRSALRELRLALRALGVLVAVYGIGIVAPRPMAALRVSDPDAVIVDVHSHTNYSHDGRADFSPRVNRAWHRAAGFDVAYITDHRSFDGATEAMALNPRVAGDSIVMLSGLEFVMHNSHLVALGLTAPDERWLYVDRQKTHPNWPPLVRPPPVLIQTIPENLDNLPPPDSSGTHGVLGIELSDGAPRGIEQAQRDRARILHLSDSLHLALVAASNNHGWGRTAVAWSVLRIPGWRALTPDSLDDAIQRRIRTARRQAVQVIERRSPSADRSRVALSATLPAVAWNLFVTLSPVERVSWIVWAWIVAALIVRAGRPGEPGRPAEPAGPGGEGPPEG